MKPIELPDDAGGEAPCYANLPDDRDDRNDPIVVDLDRVQSSGDGVAWHLPHRGDLDGNLVLLAPGSGMEAHSNDEVDVVLVILDGSGTVTIDGQIRPVRQNHLVEIDRGCERSIQAGDDGLRYLSIHRRRTGLGITGLSLVLSAFGDAVATFGLTVVSELGDKSQLLLIALATRWPRWPVALGGVLGVGAVQLVAVLIGGWIADQSWSGSLPTIIGACFVILGVVTWFGVGSDDDDPEGALIDADRADARSRLAIVGSTAGLLFLAELGDKTMFTTAALAAVRSPIGVFTGALTAFVVLAIVGVTLGARLTRRFDERTLTRAAAVLFVGLGLLTLAAA